MGPGLKKAVDTISENCTQCARCHAECGFLRVYGNPKDIADTSNCLQPQHPNMPFECNLCRLCTAVCPVGMEPGSMFLEMRRDAVNRGMGDLRGHTRLLTYEKRGNSGRYSFYGLPQGCDTVFFPGCALPGAHPDSTLKLYRYLLDIIPTVGIVLDCCNKPSHDLGRASHFETLFSEMKTILVSSGVRRILLACPSCNAVFQEYGDTFKVDSVYRLMAKSSTGQRNKKPGTVTVHDPCVLRHDIAIHDAIRQICNISGTSVREMPHHGTSTLCCGEGGAVNSVAPGLVKQWARMRKTEADGRHIITYCAGCTGILSRITPTSHVLDLFFNPEAALSGKLKPSRAPFTYLNRLLLKRKLKKTMDFAMACERPSMARTQS